MAQPEKSNVRVTPYGTRYVECPDFPEVCKEYPGKCRGDTETPGTASFRKIADAPGRRS